MELGADLFATLIDNLNDGVYFVDRKRRIHYWSRGAERLTGYGREEVAGRCCADNILVHVDEHGTGLCKGMCPLAHTMQDGQARVCDLIYFKHKEGHRVPVRVYAAPIRNEQGEIIGAVESFQTAETLPSVLDEIQALKRELYYCPLTGVANRRYAEECLPLKFDEMLRGRGKAGVLLIDVDHFKSYNDNYGHHVGDLVLKMVARTLANALRSFDIIARWGGEEFIVLMPAMIEGDVESTAARLRVLTERSSREISRERITATVSIGGVFVKESQKFAEAVQEADRLMYECKRSGRNQIRVGTLLRRVGNGPADE
jgi:diguanylate cyclase (GGDEF)-like protein/PAS domain S-box-containing protein